MPEGRVRGGALRIATLQGIPVRLHITFAVWLVYSAILLRFDWTAVVVLNAMLFGSVLLHELGHCAGARLVGGTAHEILLYPLGGLARLNVPKTPKAEFVSVGGGPAVNLALAGLGLVGLSLLGAVDVWSRGWWISTPQAGWAVYVLGTLTTVNVFLFVVNVLPVFPLDGGGLARAAVWALSSWRTATIVVGGASVFGGIGLTFFGMSTLRVLLALLGMYVAWAGWRELQRARATAAPRDDLLPHERGAAIRFHDDDLLPHERRR